MIFHFSALQVFVHVHYLCPQVFSFAYFLGYFCTHTYVYLLVNLYLYLGEESPGSSCQSMGRLVFVLAPSKWGGGTLITNHLEQTTKDSNGKTNSKTHLTPLYNIQVRIPGLNTNTVVPITDKGT